MQFNVRDLLWLTTLVAVSLAWFAERQQSRSLIAKLRHLSLYDFLAEIDRESSANNVHVLRYEYSRYYGASAEIVWTEPLPAVRRPWPTSPESYWVIRNGVANSPRETRWHPITSLKDWPGSVPAPGDAEKRSP